MSVRAYIRKDFKMIDNEGIEWYRKEFEFCYHPGYQQNITELLLEYGASDYRNEDGYGAIEITKYEFIKLIKEKFLEQNKTNRNSLMIIKNYFNSPLKGFVRLECF